MLTYFPTPLPMQCSQCQNVSNAKRAITNALQCCEFDLDRERAVLQTTSGDRCVLHRLSIDSPNYLTFSRKQPPYCWKPSLARHSDSAALDAVSGPNLPNPFVHKIYFHWSRWEAGLGCNGCRASTARQAIRYSAPTLDLLDLVVLKFCLFTYLLYLIGFLLAGNSRKRRPTLDTATPTGFCFGKIKR